MADRGEIMRKNILLFFIVIFLLIFVSLFVAACSNGDGNCEPMEEPQPETHRFSTHIQELPENERVSKIRTHITENLIFDTTRFYYTVEFLQPFELGEYEFTITQEIKDINLPINLHFYGERVYVSENGFMDVDEYSDVLDIHITDYDGNYIQQIESIPFTPWALALYLSFEDFNFDGFLDMTIMETAGGVRGGAPHYIWLWNDDTNEFTFNEELSELSFGRNIEVNMDTRQVEAWFSSVVGRNYIFLEFIEDAFTPVSTLEWIHFVSYPEEAEHLDIDPPEGYTTVLIRKDLITGEEELWFEKWS